MSALHFYIQPSSLPGISVLGGGGCSDRPDRTKLITGFILELLSNKDKRFSLSPLLLLSGYLYFYSLRIPISLGSYMAMLYSCRSCTHLPALLTCLIYPSLFFQLW